MHVTDFSPALNALGPFETAPIVAVAVSGGADSMALCLLAKHWADERRGKLVALTVDHGLRPESKAEAEQVGAWLHARDIMHHILTWNHDGKLQSGIPEAAREARYALLTKWCRNNGVLHLLVAHHADDQAETLALRKERGIKGTGLSGMSAITVRGGVRILRPLLDIPSLQLRDYLKAEGQAWVEDPTNQNLAYARNAMRKNLSGEEKKSLVLQAKALGQERKIKEARLASILAREVKLHAGGWAEWQPPAMDMSDERAQIFSALVHLIGAPKEGIRWEEARTALSALIEKKQSAVTVGGCLIAWSKQSAGLHFMRELAAIGKPAPLVKGRARWDNRFDFYIENPPANLHIEGLGEEGFLSIKPNIAPQILERIPRKVLPTLPAVKSLEEVLKVPHIKYCNPAFGHVDVTVRWTPPRPLSAHPFSLGGGEILGD